MFSILIIFFFFFFNDTATTEIYTLSLHDALPIYDDIHRSGRMRRSRAGDRHRRSEEHTSELQSLRHLVCRLLLEKKKTKLFNRRRMPTLQPKRGTTHPSINT